MPLSPVEVRVLGALVEKERTTPDGYPLSSQALVTACNQRTNRDPVTDYHLQEVQEAAFNLRERGFLRTVQGAGDRVAKHQHQLERVWDVTALELALMAVLMLRGPQTPGELRARIERYGVPNDAASVEAALRSLAERSSPLVQNLGRRPGQSQDRWRHALGNDETRLRPRVRSPENGAERASPGTGSAGAPGSERASEPAAARPSAPPSGPPSGPAAAAAGDAGLAARVAGLERRVALLEAALDEALERGRSDPRASQGDGRQGDGPQRDDA